MAVAFRAASAGAAGSTPLSVTLPTGTAAGDLLLLVADTANSAGATVAGWTLAATSPIWSANHVTVVYWKIAGSSEPSPSVNAAGSATEVMICGFTGVDATNPLDVAATFGAASAGGTVPVPGLTTLTANAWWVTLGADSAGGFTAGSTPAGWTQRARPAATTVAGHVCSTLLLAAAGAQSATSFTKGGGTAIAASLALREAGAGAAPMFVPQIIIS